MGKMNENYLLNNYFVVSGMTMNYPVVDTDYVSLYTGSSFYNKSDQIISIKKKDVSFIKKELPKFSMQETPKLFIGDLSEQDMEYFQKRLFEALKLPNWLSATSYGISDLNINYDEFH
jgi:hypothetical protein